jgi:hypothetical protein
MAARRWQMRPIRELRRVQPRMRLEYPALKRAVREHQNRFNASVVLIEDDGWSDRGASKSNQHNSIKADSRTSTFVPCSPSAAKVSSAKR